MWFLAIKNFISSPFLLPKHKKKKINEIIIIQILFFYIIIIQILDQISMYLRSSLYQHLIFLLFRVLKWVSLWYITHFLFLQLKHPISPTQQLQKILKWTPPMDPHPYISFLILNIIALIDCTCIILYLKIEA